MLPVHVTTMRRQVLVPHCCNDLQDPKLGSWYPLLLVTVYGWADLLGKLLPGVQ